MMCPSDLRTIAKAIGGDVVGHQVLAPGPRHSRKDRSLSIRLSATAPEGFIAFSHAGDNFMDCRDHVKRALGIAKDNRQIADKPAHRAPVSSGRCDDHILTLIQSIVRGMVLIGVRPTWAAGSTTILAKLPVLAGIESISVIADHDSNGAGERAARELQARWETQAKKSEFGNQKL